MLKPMAEPGAKGNQMTKKKFLEGARVEKYGTGSRARFLVFFGLFKYIYHIRIHPTIPGNKAKAVQQAWKAYNNYLLFGHDDIVVHNFAKIPLRYAYL